MNATAHDRLHSLLRPLGLLALGALAATGCVSTENGTTFGGPNVGKTITIEGFHTAPNTHVAIQVLTNPAANPSDDANWITVGTTFSSPTPTIVWANTTDLFHWTANVVLVPNAAAVVRWPEGGLVKVRAKLDNSIIISPTLDDTDCMREQNELGTPFLDAVALCESHDSGVLSLVDIDGLPNPALDFLTRKSTPLSKTADYYKAVGALTAGGLPTATRGTFAAWKTTNGFPTGEIVATYYNRGDLGFGRDMHCRTTGFGKACYVTNYGKVEDGLDDLADGSALNDAVAHVNAGATVAMEWHQAAAANQNPVRFFVYGANGALLSEIALDSSPAAKAVPGLCLACHGGTFVVPATGLPRVEGAQFLPFDVDSFAYHPDLTKEDQVDEFEDLNQLVKATVPVGSSTHELITGWHATPGVFNGEFVPAAWQTNKESKALYKYVYRPFCQMCHTTQGGAAPKTYADFSASATGIVGLMCGAPAGFAMPQAEVTYEAFWKSSARAHLTAALNRRDACDGK